MVLTPGAFSLVPAGVGHFAQVGGQQGADQMTGGVPTGSAGKVTLPQLGGGGGTASGCGLTESQLANLLAPRFKQIDARQANVEARLENIYNLLKAIADHQKVPAVMPKPVPAITPVTRQQEQQADDTRRILAAVDAKLAAPPIDLRGPTQTRDALAKLSAELRGTPAAPTATALVNK
jgi:hypothetical protein